MSAELLLSSPLIISMDPDKLPNFSVPLLLLWKIGKIIVSTLCIAVLS